MANTIVLKHNSTNGNAPGAGDLVTGEIAINATTGKVYLKKTDNSVVEVSENTDLGIISSATNVSVTCSTGTDAGIPVANASVAGIITSATFDLIDSATSANTSDAIVQRDSFGDFNSRNITLSGELTVSTGTVVLGGSGTIGGATWANGAFHLGNATSGWAMDANEFYNSGAAIIGTLDSSLTLNPTTSTTTSRPFVSTNDIEATSFTVTSGTSSQFLKADGTVDSNTQTTLDGKQDEGAQVNINVADALSFENGKHWITYNDGQGNFNIRMSHKSNSSTQEECTEAGYIAHWEYGNSTGLWNFQVSNASMAVSDFIGDGTHSWRSQLQISPTYVSMSYEGSTKIQTTSTGATITGNIAVTGTVDGRDVATDGTKLDGIASGATANTGTVTSVTGGNGLTGSVTTSGSLAVGAGAGMHVNANDVALYSAFSAGGTQTIQDEQFIVVTTAGQTITLPASPSTGDTVYISVGNFTNTQVNGNGRDIMADPSNLTIDVANVGITLVYYNTTYGWRLM